MKREVLASHPEVANFLDSVCSQIRGVARKKEIRDELLSHLESELEFTHEGDAVKKALEKFGDPKQMGRDLHLASRTWPQRVLRYVGVTFAIALMVVYMASRYSVHRLQELINQENAVVASRIPRFEADQRSLANLKLLTETSAVKSDAGRFLNLKLPWIGLGPKTEPAVSEDVYLKWVRNWMTAQIPPELSKTDVSWVPKIKEFDHWDLFQAGPNAKLIGETPILINPFVVPMPDFSIVSQAAKLHLRHGLDNGQIESALADVRHLARLCYTTETLIGSMMTASLLKVERQAYDEAIRRKMVVSARYEPISQDTLAKIKTTLWVTAGFADHAAPDVMTRVFLDTTSRWPVGSCAALAETAQHVVLTTELVTKKYPLEVEMKEQAGTLHRVFEASRPHCRLTFHRQLVSRTKDYMDVMLGDSGFSMSETWWNRLESYKYAVGRYVPYVRQGLGLELQANARPDFSSRYDQE